MLVHLVVYQPGGFHSIPNSPILQKQTNNYSHDNRLHQLGILNFVGPHKTSANICWGSSPQLTFVVVLRCIFTFPGNPGSQ